MAKKSRKRTVTRRKRTVKRTSRKKTVRRTNKNNSVRKKNNYIGGSQSGFSKILDDVNKKKEWEEKLNDAIDKVMVFLKNSSTYGDSHDYTGAIGMFYSRFVELTDMKEGTETERLFRIVIFMMLENIINNPLEQKNNNMFEDRLRNFKTIIIKRF
jgi:hypothetical protein